MIGCSREIRPRATATLSSSSLKFGVTTLFDAAVAMQQHDFIEFPVISWFDDDEREDIDDHDITSPEAASSSNIRPDEEEKVGLGSNCKLTTKRGLLNTPQQEDNEGAHRMVRSKALHSELSLLASSLSPSRSSSTKRHGVVAELA
jgi:hypothetical protein